MNGEPTPGSSPGGQDQQLVDLTQLRNYSGYVLRSMRRHFLVAAGALLGVLALTLAVLATFPRVYHVEAELLAQRQAMMPALGNPGRSVPTDADEPTRAAAEIVRRRDNLVSLVKQTGLLDRWDQTRAPVTKVRDALVRLFTGPETEEERLDALVELLEKCLYVVVGERTITIGIDFPDKQLAFQLVETAQSNFLEARHAAEVTSIAEAISILERHAADVQQSVDSALDEVKRMKPAHPLRASDIVPLAPSRTSKTNLGRTNEISEVRTMLDAKLRAIKELEDFRTRRITELQAELGMQKQVYADAHPTMVRLKQSMAAAAEEPAQLTELRRDARELTAELTQLAGDQYGERDGELRIAPQRLNEARRLLGSTSDLPSEEYAKARLRFAMNKYDSLLERLDAARIELDTARAAFKYRYTVIRPAELPKRAVKPRVPVVIGYGLFAALLAAAAAAALVDVRSRRVVERWQIEQQLGLPVLGDLPRA